MTPSSADRNAAPARRHPPEVYRRRRVTVLGLAVLVLALFIVGIVLLVQSLSGQTAQTAKPQEKPGASAGQPKSEQDNEAPGPQGDEASGMCPEDQITVAASMDKNEYDPGAKAAMTLQVKNEHSAECKIEVGSSSQQFIIQQEDQTVWNSSWCSTDGQKSQQVFAPGATKKSTLNWTLIPTDKNCNKTADSFEPGKYQLIVELGNATSKPHPFTVKDDESTDEPTKDSKDSADSKDSSDSKDSKSDKKN